MPHTHLKTYLTSIQDISPTAKEHSHRTPLEILLRALTANQANRDKIQIIHEPNNDKDGKGAPDFRIEKHSLVLGCIENKRVTTDLNEILQSAQIAKYSKISPNIILTDYLNFWLIDAAQDTTIDTNKVDSTPPPRIIKQVEICTLSNLHATLHNPPLLSDKATQLQELFDIFLSRDPKLISNAIEFTHSLSLRARILKNKLLAMPHEQNALYAIFKDRLYKDLDYREFCDSFAQTLVYSLFLAKLNSPTDHLTLASAHEHIPQSFPLVRAMCKQLDELCTKDTSWVIQEILTIINHIDISAIIKELNTTGKKSQAIQKDPYLHFYETFLASYDPALRKSRGVYYTPASVVRFIITSIDEILTTTFAHEKGLGSALEDDSITLLDFATGTGTFLLESFRKALSAIPQDSPHYKPKVLLNRFSGFEFLIAPYTIAHLKLSQAFSEEFGTPLSAEEHLNITLTNTLYFNTESSELNQKQTLLYNEKILTEEFKKAQQIKQSPILIITGNPPYSGASSNKGLYEYEVRTSYGLEPKRQHFIPQEKQKLESYLTTYIANKSLNNKELKNAKKYLQGFLANRKLENEKNPKWLLDDYVKFIRFAQRKIDSEPSGIFGFISNNAFIDNPTFRGMRYSLMQSFDSIYILNLHGDANKKETTPNGGKDENVFDIKQGVSINLFVKSATKGTEPKIHYYDLYGKRADKYHLLESNTLDSIPWETFTPQAPFYLFTPQNKELRAHYDKGKGMGEIFKFSSVGVCGGKDKVVFHKTEESIKSLIQDFCSLDAPTLVAKYDISPDSRDWQIQRAKDSVTQSQKEGRGRFLQVDYRPFDKRWTYYNRESRAFISYPRTDIMEHFLEKENIGLVCDRRCLSKELDNIFITESLIDLHLIGGGSNIFPLYLYPTSRMKPKQETLPLDDDQTPQRCENFTPEFRAFIDEKYSTHFSPKEILGYIYAVLFHRDYRAKYTEFFRIDFPKVFFVASRQDFQALSALGSELIALHLLKSPRLDPAIGASRYYDPTHRSEQIQTSTYDEESKRIFVNASLCFENVLPAVWEYEIGKKRVLEQYLKSHKGENIDYAHFEKVIRTLDATIKLQDKITQIKLT